MGLNREITLLTNEKRLEGLYCMIDVYQVGIYHLKGRLKGVCQLDAHKRLNDALLDVVKHPSDNSQVKL